LSFPGLKNGEVIDQQHEVQIEMEMHQAANQQITLNDIHQLMDKIEEATTDEEREALHAELEQALCLWDEIHQQPLQSSSDKVHN
jgi:hypothetical protein